MTELKLSVCSESLCYRLCSFGPPLTGYSFSSRWPFGIFSLMLCGSNSNSYIDLKGEVCNLFTVKICPLHTYYVS